MTLVFREQSAAFFQHLLDSIGNTFGWYAMLISAGMGIGLMIWSVAEPVFYYASPSPMFDVSPQTAEAAQDALGLTYYHWGIHMEGVCAAALLMGGGLVALQNASIATGLPFTIVLLVMCFSLYRGLQEEHYHATIIGKMQPETHRIEIPLAEGK